jgi:hypothetical protein
MYKRFFIAISFVFLMCGCAGRVSAQFGNDPFNDREEEKRQESIKIKAMLAKQQAEHDKKEHEELLKNGEEALELSGQLEKSFEVNPTLTPDDKKKLESLEKLATKLDGRYTAVVGKPARYVAACAGFTLPAGARVIVTPLSKVGPSEPLSQEKLTTVLGWYVVDGWERGCELSIAIIETGGRGHTQVIHARDERIIMAYGLEKPVFRILVNTMGTLGAIGLTTGLMPSLTLGPGGLGGAITGDNITASHLINIKRLVYETVAPPAAAFSLGGDSAGPSAVEIEQAVRSAVEEILKSGPVV